MMNAQKIEISQKLKPIVTKKIISPININKPIVQKKILSFNGPSTSCTNEGKRFELEDNTKKKQTILSSIFFFIINLFNNHKRYQNYK